MHNEEKKKIDEMRTQGCSYMEIAQRLSLSVNTVKSYCRRNQLSADDRTKAPVCKQCGLPLIIIKKKRPKLFCSDKCRMVWWTSHNMKKAKTVYNGICNYCSKPYISYGRTQKYCSHQCYIAERFGKGGESNE